MNKNKRKYTLGEEIFNSISHGVGVIISLIALIVMIVISARQGSILSVISSVVFGVTLIMLYTSSTLYHALINPITKRVFQILDHCAIFLLIAGTYTSYALLTIGGIKGWIIFGVIWFCAIAGIILNSINLKKFQFFSIILYLSMGWTVVFYLKDLIINLALSGIILLAIGGMAYTFGIIFYLIKKIKYFHSVWHLLVLFGSICHILSVMFFVI